MDVTRIIDEETDRIKADLVPADTPQGQGTLGLMGLEIVVVWIATKVVVPVACSIVSRVLYDRFKGLKTPIEAAQATAALGEAAAEGLRDPAEKAVVLRELTEELVHEGVDRTLSLALIESAHDSLKSRLSADAARDT
jgi:hypothetical protein